MYQAPIVALVIIVAYIWRAVTWKLEKSGTVLPIYAHYYTILYVLTLILMCMATKSLYTDVLSVTDWLSPPAVEEFVKQVMEQSEEDRNSNAFATWKAETDIGEMPWLRYLAISSPVWCVGTFIVCALHTRQHIAPVMKHKGISKNGECLWSDHVILIMALPMIYGLMSFKSVIRSLQIYINHVPPAGGQTDATQVRFAGYEQRKGFLNEMYAANFAVGDLMETIALVTFGQLIAAYLKHRMEITKAHMDKKDVDKEDVDTLVAATETVSALTVAGVQLFCLACVLSSGWDLTITTMPQYFPGVADNLFSIDPNNLGSLQKEETRASAEQFFLGFSFAASFAAIGNIMTLEQNYHHFLQKFVPSMKFWGTKILVSLACMQACILGLMPGTVAQHNLIYACIMNIECCLIAIFHFHAWGATEEWLEHQHNPELAMAAGPVATGMDKPLLGSCKLTPV